MPGGNKRKTKDDEQSVTSESKLPVKSVQALMGEGEKFFRDQLFLKAIQCYTEVLDLSPGNKNALVERASCYLKIGKNDLALQDAEESLKENKEFTKGLYQKAEALYAMGEFELSLVFFHRGKKLRGDVREFQLGINKAQEAIDNCVGDPHSVKLEVKGDLSYFEKPDEKQKKQKQGGYIKPLAQKQQIQQKREKRVEKNGNQKTVQQLLGELYADKMYLQKLLDDDIVTKQNTRTGDAIYSLANNGLDFLDSRTEFWRQQKPIYARKRKEFLRSPAGSKDPLNYILQQLEAIDNLQNSGRYSESLQKCDNLMSFVTKLPEKYEKDKPRLFGNIYSNRGNAYLELGKYDLALQSHQKDLELAETSGSVEDKSRALENLGRVYARNGRFKDAIDVWEEKLPLATNDIEKAWLYHEIGRCYLELGNNEKAREYGQQSFDSAQRINDEIWQLNATVLIAQSEAKMGDIDNMICAIEHFEKALEMTKKQNDVAAENAISKALSDCREKLHKLEANETQRLSDFKVEIKTGSDNGAGTDANVFLDIHGIRANLTDLALKTSETNTNPFEANHTDVFSINQQKNIGRIKKIAIRHDSAGVGSAWKVDTITITKDNKEVYFFAVDKWIERSTGDKKAGLELTPTKVTNLDGKPAEEPKQQEQKKPESKTPDGNKSQSKTPANDSKNNSKTPSNDKSISKTPVNDSKNNSKTPATDRSTEEKNVEYTITVRTGDRLGSGTDSKVFLIIYGANSETEKLRLKRDNEKDDKKLFEKGSSDVLKLTALNVGEIKKINISHDGVNVGDGWYLDSITIEVKGKTYNFKAERWLDKHEGDGKTEVDLHPESTVEKKDTNGKNTDYEITVKTGSKIGAGTDSKVYLIIYGSQLETEKLRLKRDNDKEETKLFEKGAIDVFKINALDVDEIKKINISHDGVNIGDGWYLNNISIKSKGKTYDFKCDRWLDKHEADGKTALDLTPSA